MTDPLNSHSENIQGWAGGEEGDPIGSLSDITSNVQSDIASLGNVFSDVGDLPATATPRAPEFSGYDDLFEYLEQGGLVHTGEDVNGDLFNIPNPIVHIIPDYDEDLDDFTYHVYIDSDTGAA